MQRRSTVENKAISQLCAFSSPKTMPMSVMAMLRQLGRGTLRAAPFQQKHDDDTDDNERPDPSRVDVEHTHSREQEHDTTDQK